MDDKHVFLNVNISWIRMFIVGGTRALEGAWPWYTLIKYRSLNDVGDDIGTAASDYLQQTRLPLLTKEDCSQRWRKLKSYGGGFDIASTQLCAGSLGHGTAQGDSGGPLMIRNDEGQWYQIGITSFGINTGPGYYDQNMAPVIPKLEICTEVNLDFNLKP
ncbi:trypsin [Necator americanus]|uniref:Trypsin n=1 Tax=Necator americanus TaxID=51031 RepID=W2T2G8_NECAM|nr:trypsin [Necator americanus]ETN76200.1 trypsin [Necator americanus]